MSTDGSSRLVLVLTGLLSAVPPYLLVTYRHCRGPGEGGTVALVVAVCYVLASVAVFALHR